MFSYRYITAFNDYMSIKSALDNDFIGAPESSTVCTLVCQPHSGARVRCPWGRKLFQLYLLHFWTQLITNVHCGLENQATVNREWIAQETDMGMMR